MDFLKKSKKDCTVFVCDNSCEMLADILCDGVTLINNYRRHDLSRGPFGSIRAVSGPSAAISLFVFAII